MQCLFITTRVTHDAQTMDQECETATENLVLVTQQSKTDFVYLHATANPGDFPASIAFVLLIFHLQSS